MKIMVTAVKDTKRISHRNNNNYILELDIMSLTSLPFGKKI